jgi:hypothetical protein
MFRHWMTTLCGLLVASPLIIKGIEAGSFHAGWWWFLAGFGMAALGAVSKDFNKSGGIPA